jgi:hypothetical protein
MCLDFRQNPVITSNTKRPFQIWSWPSQKTYWEVTPSRYPLTKVPSRPNPKPNGPPSPPRHLPNLHHDPRLRSPGHRSHPPNPPIPLPSPDQKRRGFPSLRPRCMAPRRRIQNELFLFRRCECHLAVQGLCGCADLF